MGFKHLLTALLPAFIRRVIYADDKLIVMCIDIARDFKAEWAIAAGMGADELAIDPHLALPIYRAKVQNDLFAVKGLTELKRAAIPKQLIRL